MTSGPRILLVEDHAAVRSAIATMLVRDGYCVTQARDAAEAIAMLEQGTIVDVAVVDVILPQPGSTAVLEALSERVRPRRVLLISGYDPEVLRRMALGKVLDAVNFRFLEKPFSWADLTRTVADLLSTRTDAVRLVTTDEWPIPE